MGWEIRVTSGDNGEEVSVYRDGSWFSEAEDVYDAVGILHAQRVTQYTFNDRSSISEESL